MKFCVMICTYDRPDAIKLLTQRLKSLEDCHIVVIDDGTKDKISKKNIDTYLKNVRNQGKHGWYRTVNKLWKAARSIKADYYIMLPDDALPKDNFFTDAVRLWESIKDQRKIALHLANNGRVENWTQFKRRDYTNELFLTQTTEFNFICHKEFITYEIPVIHKRRWNRRTMLGSGVGNLLNFYWIRSGKNIYGVKKSLITANPGCPDSKMNTQARKQYPWKLL